MNLFENLQNYKEAFSKNIPQELLNRMLYMNGKPSEFMDVLMKKGFDPSKIVIDKVDKFHERNPNYIPIKLYQYNSSSSSGRNTEMSGLVFGGRDLRNKDSIWDDIRDEEIIGRYEIDLTKNQDAIIGDRYTQRQANKNDPKNKYINRNANSFGNDKSGYYTAGKWINDKDKIGELKDRQKAFGN